MAKRAAEDELSTERISKGSKLDEEPQVEDDVDKTDGSSSNLGTDEKNAADAMDSVLEKAEKPKQSTITVENSDNATTKDVEEAQATKEKQLKNMFQLPKAEILTESTEFKDPFMRHAKLELSSFWSSGGTSTKAPSDTSIAEFGVLPGSTWNSNDVDNFAAGENGVDGEAILVQFDETGETILFTDSSAKFSRFVTLDKTKEWVHPITGKVTLSIPKDSSSPLILFHQSGTGRLLLNSPIIEGEKAYRVFHKKSVLFVGISSGEQEAGKLAQYRITFSTTEVRDTFLAKIKELKAQ